MARETANNPRKNAVFAPIIRWYVLCVGIKQKIDGRRATGSSSSIVPTARRLNMPELRPWPTTLSSSSVAKVAAVVMPKIMIAAAQYCHPS
jgi:hypothetical protein